VLEVKVWWLSLEQHDLSDLKTPKVEVSV